MPTPIVELRRAVRFSINPPADPADGASIAPSASGYSANPAPRGLSRHYELRVACVGPLDGDTGYLINIKTIDRAVRDAAVPIIADAAHHRPNTDPASLLPALLRAVADRLPVAVRGISWQLSPYASFEMHADPRSATPDAAPQPARAILRQRYELAASHRLHVPEWSDEANREAFGKCNNVSGHGHNYVVEPEVAVTVDAHVGPRSVGCALDLATLDRVVHQAILDPYDHMYLNEVRPFAPAPGERAINPSVENIARVFFERLGEALAAAAPQATLVRVCVWETDRTSALYPG